jgi:hypothetical protein
MNSQDYTAVMRRIDALQERLDSVFKRVNADPIYETEQSIADAISDNPRYYNEDRKKELAEIFFALLDQIYDRIVKQDVKNTFCNPQIPAGSKPRLPEMEMFFRVVMPLGWALEAKWASESLKNVRDAYLATYTQEEAQLVYDLLGFLFELFPEFTQTDVLEYWRMTAGEPDSMRPESDEDKSFMLSVLIQKKAAMEAAKKG